MMKKSTFGVFLAFLAAAVGALTAAALYLHHREKELDEYEQLLFSDDEDELEEMDEEAECPAESKAAPEAECPAEKTEAEPASEE